MKAFIDIETGGFSIEKNGICEIAMVVTDDDCKSVAEFQRYIKPYLRPYSDELVSYKDDAMAVNGILVSDLEDKGNSVSEVVRGFVDLIKSHNDLTLIGHNSILFDFPRIEHLIHRFYNLASENYQNPIRLSTYPKEDTKIIAQKKIKVNSYSLENLCTHFGIVNEKAHSALSDVYATIELYKKLKSIG